MAQHTTGHFVITDGGAQVMLLTEGVVGALKIRHAIPFRPY